MNESFGRIKSARARHHHQMIEGLRSNEIEVNSACLSWLASEGQIKKSLAPKLLFVITRPGNFDTRKWVDCFLRVDWFLEDEGRGEGSKWRNG